MINTTTHRLCLQFISVVAATVIASALQAQVSVRVVAHTNLIVGNKTIPRGTNVTKGASLRYGTSVPPCYEYGSMRVIVSQAAPTSVRFVNASSSWCSPAPIVGTHAIRITLTSPVAISGFCLVDCKSKGITNRFSVDVGNDGLIELQDGSQFSGLRLLEMPLVVGPSGVDIVVSCHAYGNGTGATLFADVDLTVKFSSATSSKHLRPIGTPCGPEVSPRYTQTHPFFVARKFTIDVTKAAPTARSWFIVGLRQQNISIPPLGCRLYTDVVVPVIAVVNPAGKARMSIQVPASISTGQAIVQFVSGTLDLQGRLIWNTSQAVQLRL